ncbi:MAG: D-alanyl-D-alanine carboxypeptidase family protein [Pseudorhodoplanes sp.]
MNLSFPALRTALPKSAIAAILLAGAAALPAGKAQAQAMLLIEADSGRVLHQENATQKWYPASVTKLMTAYVTLKAVKAGKISLDTLITVSPNAVAQAPTKMGFKAGSQITVDNAIKSIMVKSANDMSVTLAEGVSGSIAGFAEEMNRAAARLGMTQTTYVNPNGLPADEQITSARDMAILARAIYRELPEYEMYWRISAIKYGKRVMRNYNTLLDRYPGTDGMKTGFICASGFNIVVSAKRNGRRLIAVMLGAPSGGVRAVKVAQMLERGFQTGTFNWLTSAGTSVDQLKAIDNPPPNLRDEICGKKRKRPAAESEDHDEDEGTEAALPPGMDPSSPQAVALAALRTANSKPSALIGPWTPSMEPVEVFLGAYKGAVPVQTADAPKKKAKKKDIVATSPGAVQPVAAQPAAAAKPQTQQVIVPVAAAAPAAGAPPAKKAAKKKQTPSGAPANAEAAAKPPAQRPAQPAAQPAAR